MNNKDAFLRLVEAGLWGGKVRCLPSDIIDFFVVYQLAQEQSVVGLVTAGLGQLKNVVVPLNVKLNYVGDALQIEQRNVEMNMFVAELVEMMRNKDIPALLLKGQGIAQCYMKPLWRTSGDIDLLLSENDYDRAKDLLCPMASVVENEYSHFKHLGMTIDGWSVELHGTLHSRLSKRVDDGIDATQRELFYGGKVRSVWFNSLRGSKVQVFLPAPDEDVIFVFTHILNHFYKGGIGLRQICDWCRLLWTYRDTINRVLLKKRLCSMGLMTEWKAFAAFVVEYLGMPSETMPFYSSEYKWSSKAHKIRDFILEVGNFGHNRDMGYYNDKPYLERKAISFGRRYRDFFKHVFIFPFDSLRFFPQIMFNGLCSAVRGE